MKYCYGNRNKPLYCNKECDCELLDCTMTKDALCGKSVYVKSNKDNEKCIRDNELIIDDLVEPLNNAINELFNHR